MKKMIKRDALYSSRSEEWSTPQDLFDELDRMFHFTLDPCSTDENKKCEKHYTKEQDGLKQDWTGETVFCNPPYGRGIEQWCKKCYEHSQNGGTAVLLVHARTDTKWFHKWVYHKAELVFVKGRLHFGGSKWSAPFPSMIAVYRPNAVLCMECAYSQVDTTSFPHRWCEKKHQYVAQDATCGDGIRWNAL